MQRRYLLITLVWGVGLACALQWAAGSGPLAWAAPAIEVRVCPSGCAYASVQAAVDAAPSGALIKIAEGTYTDLHARAGITQVVYLTKTLVLRGGYTPTNWEAPNPAAHPTTLDAGGLGRVLVISGTIAPTLEGLRLTGGDATGLGGQFWGDAGGALYVDTASPTLRDSLIYSNTAGTGISYGGALYVHHGSPALTNNVFRDNTAGARGGAIYVDAATVGLTGNALISNTAALQGGGACLYWSLSTWTGNTIEHNHASVGGGLYLYGNRATLAGNRLHANTATQAGGLHAQALDPLVMTNNVLTANQATGPGSGLWAGGYPVLPTRGTLRHTTLAANAGQGIFLAPYATLALTNTVIVSHTVGLTATAGSTATLDSTLWHANVTGWAGQGAISTRHDTAGDPALAPDGYHLSAASAALDRGVDAGVADDIDGEVRPQGRGPDLGADEFPLPPVYLPLVIRSQP